MNYDRRTEAETILRNDRGRLGDTFRGDQEGLSLEEQAEIAGARTSNYGYNNRAAINALIEGTIPKGPTLALQVARRVRTLLKRPDLSPQLRADWQILEEELMLRAEDRIAVEQEEAVTAQATSEAESAGTPGIYVYTLPHYRRHPIDPESGKTFLKVGHSARDALYRAGAQARFTALPEDPVLLRIYPTDESASTERLFHDWLEAADHQGTRTGRAGKEWFLTSIKFLDQIASSLELEKIAVNHLGMDDE